MLAILLKRLAWAPAALLGITLVVFTLTRSLPGDPVAFYIGTSGVRDLPAEAVLRLRHERGLDRAPVVQYMHWVRAAFVEGDLGRSFTDDEPVVTKIVESVPNTLLLNGVSLLFTILIAVPAGVWIAARQRRDGRERLHLLFFALYAIPTFWLALVLAALFAVRWPLLPLYGMTSEDHDTLSAAGRLFDVARHMVLPVIALSVTQLAILARFTTNAFRDALGEQYISAARARGVGKRSVLWRHAGRNAAVPLISLAGVLVPSLLSGSVIIERMFQWRGVGGLLFESVVARDYPVIMGVTLFVAVGVLIVSVLLDAAYVLADPRIRLTRDAAR